MSSPVPSAAGGGPRAAARAPIAAGLVGLALVLASVALLALRARAHRPEPPQLVTLPDFRLTERSGRSVGRDDLRGRPWIADFIFTQCGGICPAMTARMARLRREVPSGVRFVSFTVDPATDTPEVLRGYAQRFGADGDWLFLTGEQKALYDLSVGGFKLAAMEVPAGERAAGGDGPFLHSAKFVLVDGAGVVRGYYDSEDEESLRALVADVRAIAPPS
jgi:protein SCO1/2